MRSLFVKIFVWFALAGALRPSTAARNLLFQYVDDRDTEVRCSAINTLDFVQSPPLLP